MPRKEAPISRESLFKKLDYEPHSEAQWEAHNSPARFRVASCGRRWGKSTWAGHDMTYRMWIPNTVNWIVGPDYSLGEKEFRIVWNDFKRLGILNNCKKQYSVNQGNMRLHFTDINSVLEVKSAQKPDSLVGEGLDHVIMSEAAKHNLSTWQMYIEPALSDKRGSADFPSTPQGYNWFQAMYDLGQLQGKEYVEYASWTFPSWTNPISFPGGYYDDEMVRLRQRVSEMYWRQEYAAEFTAFEGMIYDEFNPKVHVKEFDYVPEWKNCLALDFGFTDPFVCLDIMIDHMGRVWVWREYQVSGKSTRDHGDILVNRENPPGYHVDLIAADPRGADEIATLAWIMPGIQAHPVGWVQGVEEIKRALKKRPDGTYGMIIHPRCEILIKQLQRLRSKTIKEGHNEKPGQHDYFDHGPDALRYFFNEYFVLGGGQSLTDVYDASYKGSEAESFFTLKTGFSLNDAIGF